MTRRQLLESALGLLPVPKVVGMHGSADADAMAVEGIVSSAEHETDEGYFNLVSERAGAQNFTVMATPRDPLWTWLRNHRTRKVEIVFLAVPRTP